VLTALILLPGITNVVGPNKNSGKI
jgi:hypothetical protein